MLETNYLLFDNLETRLPLIEPEHFRTYAEYGYNPESSQPDPDTVPVQEYWTSFLVPDIDTFTQIRTKLLDQLDEYRQGQVNRIPVIVVSEQYLGEYDGTHNVFWVLEPGWYTRLGSEEFMLTLHGYGEPLVTQSRIAENQSFSIVENAVNGQVVGTVQGARPDLELGGRPDLPFSYDATSGILSVNGTLDFETTDEYTLTIGGVDVVVYILDSVEDPIPERTDYTFYLEPDAKPGTQIGTIAVATQGESGSKPVFSLVTGNPASNFAIDPVTGELTLLSLSGISSGHILTIGYGVIGETVNATIQLLNSTGSLDLPAVRYSVVPYLPVSSVIGTFSNTSLEYKLEAFEVGINESAQLVVLDSASITEGLLEYQVEALDPTTGATGEFTVYVSVYDPAQLTAYQEFWIPVDSTNGSSVGQVEFTNIDSNSVALAFSLSPDSPIGINTQTGELIVTKASQLEVTTYELTASANSGTYSRSVRVVVFDVVKDSDLTFTVAPTASSGVVVGVLGSSLTYPVTVTNGSLGTYALDLATGSLTVATTPPANASFTVTDTDGNTLSVQVNVTTETDTGGDTEYLGQVFAGQSGQAIASISNIRYSLGSVGFGQGSLQVVPDGETGSYSRTLGGSVVVNRPATLHSRLTINTTVTQAMNDELVGYWQSNPVDTVYTVSVSGTDWQAYLVSYQATYSDTIAVQLTLGTT